MATTTEDKKKLDKENRETLHAEDYTLHVTKTEE
jgi:hypothetical protein